ncbi:unnamed protein product, partial [marine sediment metagenome]
MPDLFGWMSGFGGIKQTLYYLMFLVPILLGAGAVLISLRNRKIYRYKARIYLVR